MSLLLRIEEGDLDLKLDQVSDGEKYKAVTEGCEYYVPGRRIAAAGMGAKRESFQYHDTDVAITYRSSQPSCGRMELREIITGESEKYNIFFLERLSRTDFVYRIKM